jgi:hypothetical protein
MGFSLQCTVRASNLFGVPKYHQNHSNARRAKKNKNSGVPIQANGMLMMAGRAMQPRVKGMRKCAAEHYERFVARERETGLFSLMHFPNCSMIKCLASFLELSFLPGEKRG